MRALRIVVPAALAAAVTLASLAGCGGSLKLPTEARGIIPADSSYQLMNAFGGFNSIRSVKLTPVGELFVLFGTDGGTGHASRGAIGQYALATGTLIPRTWPFLFNPWTLAVQNDTIYVLDRGDTCLARVNPRFGDCRPDSLSGGKVSDLAAYWRVRMMRTQGGDTVCTFTDTTFAWVNGITADAQGRVYVSGLAIVNVPDVLDNRIRTRTFLPRVWRYQRGPRYPGIVPDDINMPGGGWHRDTTWEVASGTGFGFVTFPNGLSWGSVGGTGLFVADGGQNTIKRVTDQASSSAYLQVQPDQLDIDGVYMNNPTDVVGDAHGFFYVVDQDNARALRFSPEGQYVQQVDPTHQLVGPVALAANDSLVYVADRTAGKLFRFKRRQ